MVTDEQSVILFQVTQSHIKLHEIGNVWMSQKYEKINLMCCCSHKAHVSFYGEIWLFAGMIEKWWNQEVKIAICEKSGL